MLFSEGNAEESLAPSGWRALLDGAIVPRFVSSRLTLFDGARPRRPPTLLVRSLVVTLATVLAILVCVFAWLIADFRANASEELQTVLLSASALRALLGAALGSLVLAALGSLWLASRLSGPIDAMSRTLSAAVNARDFGVRLESGGSSREVDDLTQTFNALMAGLSRAEAETREASLDAIEALAKALEARDVYTAGHSERVGRLAVRVGREMGLAASALEVLRLGASLHDIGKIGVADTVLRKPGPLTPDEQKAIETHPLVGARILQPVAFLAAHMPVVELHHERPDGRGYPHGLSGDRIPLPARIVHLADAFDAMTSDRPYRPSRPASEAIAEIVRCRGVEFDEEVVQAFLRVVGYGRLTSPSRTPVAGNAASCR